MTNAEPLFVDTNVLVYANVLTAPQHSAAQGALRTANAAGRPLWISRQVLREFIAARTRPQTFAQPSSPAVVIARVRYLQERFAIADETAAVTQRLIHLLQTVEVGGKQIHDANIVATMLTYGIPCLLTHNVRDFARFAGLIRIEGL